MRERRYLIGETSLPCERCLCCSCKFLADCPIYRTQPYKGVYRKELLKNGRKITYMRSTPCTQNCNPSRQFGKKKNVKVRITEDYNPRTYEEGKEKLSCEFYQEDDPLEFGVTKHLYKIQSFIPKRVLRSRK